MCSLSRASIIFQGQSVLDGIVLIVVVVKAIYVIFAY